MNRTWTEQTILEWKERRNTVRKAKDLPSLDALYTSARIQDTQLYAEALQAEKSNTVERLERYYTKTVAWEVEKHPTESYPAPCSGVLQLPLNFRQSHGFIQIKFNQGDDLNRVVYSFYWDKVDVDYKGNNFVSTDAVLCARYEYLGPAPCVVGFQFDADQRVAYIEWRDRYLRQKWVCDRTWKIELYFDEAVQGWVSRPRGNFDCSLDIREYLGAPAD